MLNNIQHSDKKGVLKHYLISKPRDGTRLQLDKVFAVNNVEEHVLHSIPHLCLSIIPISWFILWGASLKMLIAFGEDYYLCLGVN